MPCCGWFADDWAIKRHRQNAVLRELGRALSDMRDSTVPLQTLTWQRRRHPHQLSQKEFDFLKKTLAKRQAAQLPTFKAATILRSEKLGRIEHGI